MQKIPYTHNRYQTLLQRVSPLAQRCPSLVFYTKFLRIVVRSASQAKRGQYDGVAWSDSSIATLRALESVGVQFEISGVSRFATLQEPCVFVANHMSMLETVILPGIIQPEKHITFVVKQSLLEYPIFKHVMRSREPIAVNRQNPRHDFQAVMEGGVERLRKGISIIVFPQTTRMRRFDPEHFNSIGVKLAKRANVPVVPVALQTHAWENGRYVKDLGKILPARKVYFAFGDPRWVQKRGNEEHAAIIEFIQTHLAQWPQ